MAAWGLFVLVAGLLAVGFSGLMARNVLSRSPGTAAMQEVAGMIYEGAMAFLYRQYRTIMLLAIVAAVLIGALLGVLGGGVEIAWRTAVAFLVGAVCSALSGYIG